MSELTITLETISLVDFLGVENQNIKKISAFFPETKIISRGNEIIIKGTSAEVAKIEELFRKLLDHYHKFGSIQLSDIETLVNGRKETHYPPGDGNEHSVSATPEFTDLIFYGIKGIPVRAKTPNQKLLVTVCHESDIIFAVGSAGTGKTYTAVALAVKALKNKEVKKIIITRPAVEAGENLGFLPGDLKEKVDPYLRPVYDALDDMIDPEKLKQYIDTRIIEIAPLAYMRGRTLNNAYCILDEAQNATDAQIKMFLTRMGVNSKMIITGDTTQIDLPSYQRSGLVHAVDLLRNINGIGFVFFNNDDVLRHRLVKEIVTAYENQNQQGKS